MKIILTDPAWFEEPETFVSLEELHQCMADNFDLTGDEVYLKVRFSIEGGELYEFFAFDPPRYSGEKRLVGHVID